jgi:hypothetical protein
MTDQTMPKEQVQDLRNGLDLVDLFFGEHGHGKAVLHAFDGQLSDHLMGMLMAESVDELAARQNQAVGILKALERMGANMALVRARAIEKAGKRAVRQALSLHETVEP